MVFDRQSGRKVAVASWFTSAAVVPPAKGDVGVELEIGTALRRLVLRYYHFDDADCREAVSSEGYWSIGLGRSGLAFRPQFISDLVSWGAINDATGYWLNLFGGRRGPDGQMGDMVMWSSSFTRQFGGGLTDWLTPAQVAGLVRDRTVLSPTATNCTVPAEVKRDAPDFRVIMLNAFGPEENFAYPPRPDNPRTPWNLQWTARIRHKSTTSLMDIPGMPDMGGMDDPRQSQQAQQQHDAPVVEQRTFQQ